MFSRNLSNEKGSVYPIAIVFFLSAIMLLSHTLTLYSIQYKTYDGLENMHRHATIQLLMDIEQNKMPE
ncbi:hypothetical protein A1A1_12437 [Planococcus antarcticus DSM 14505]|uniref:Uncharacterized protein n=1 Tax=Planococcus antarcticus DSM 14505 TaxID=1185653 RepID=A0A1C7DIW3_9BACL|nr:hypothetical protein [Planococcus antarcticus]ANU11163.1 hypothetical protein BBH88_13090 [Planococcus antarcticus DSM 14505]EIM06183.1 hypothetical protein A1A1_12437 [Planococcus antarcticus DSM 14505]